MKKRHKRKMAPHEKSAAAKKLLSKRMNKKMVLGTNMSDKVPVQPDTTDQNKEMIE